MVCAVSCFQLALSLDFKLLICCNALKMLLVQPIAVEVRRKISLIASFEANS